MPIKPELRCRDGKGRQVPSPALRKDMPVRRPRWCWPQHILITTQCIAGLGTAMSEHSAHAAICCTSGRSIGADPADAAPAAGVG
jgi:hypothetical protein